MEQISVADGTGQASVPKAAYDAALAAAGIERFNLVSLSSMIPAAADLTVQDRIDLSGAVGALLPVVQARAIVTDESIGAAGLAWARRENGEGIFFEASATGPEAMRRVDDRLEAGIAEGLALRDWEATDRDRLTVSIENPSAPAGCAVVVAAFGAGMSPWVE